MESIVQLQSLCGATLFGSHQLHLPPSVWVGPFAYLRVRRLATKHAKRRIYKGWVKPPVPF